MPHRLLVVVLGLLTLQPGCGTTALSTTDHFMDDERRPRLWEGLETGYVPPTANWFDRHPMATAVGVAVLVSAAAGVGAAAVARSVAGGAQ